MSSASMTGDDVFSMIASAGFRSHRLLLEGAARQDALDAAAQYILGACGGVIPPRQHGVVSAVHGLASYAPAMAVAWAENTFATIDIGHRLAAAFVGTSLPSELAKDVEMPWRCFRVVVPPGVLHDHGASILTMRSTTGKFWTITHGGPGLMSIGEEPSFEGFVGMFFKGTTGPVDPAIADKVSVTNRRTAALHQIVAGVCIELATRPTFTPPPPGRSKKSNSREPTIWRFQLTRPVEIDIRQQVRDYIEHGGRSPTLHTWVRGHYKRQPHGPGGALRKWIHVEPHWRGPTDGPIALRPHKLRDES